MVQIRIATTGLGELRAFIGRTRMVAKTFKNKTPRILSAAMLKKARMNVAKAGFESPTGTLERSIIRTHLTTTKNRSTYVVGTDAQHAQAWELGFKPHWIGLGAISSDGSPAWTRMRAFETANRVFVGTGHLARSGIHFMTRAFGEVNRMADKEIIKTANLIR